MRIFIFLLFLNLCCYSDSLIHIFNFGDLQNAMSVSCGREEFIFVTDISTNQIYKFNKDGELLVNFGGTGLGENELNQPYSIDATNGLDVIVTDYRNNQLKRLDYDLRFIQLFNFNLYNLTADHSAKIYNPKSVSITTTGEIFFLCDAGPYKAAKLLNYSEVPVLFASNAIIKDRVEKPSKIITGLQLDIWILDLASGDILNYNNSGVFLKRIKNREEIIPISFTSSGNYIYILFDGYLLVYDMKNNSYVQKLFFPYISGLRDIAILKTNFIVFLTKSKIHIYSLKKE